VSPARLAAVSFPHGRYSGPVLTACQKLGFELMFSSDACINAAPDGRRASALLERISIEAGAITNRCGSFVPERLATWLFHSPLRRLDDRAPLPEPAA
jgi:hypothetical protein